MTGTVLEEGLRGAGGHLLDGDGRRFMFDYDERGERATRDTVSRSIYAEMRGGRTSTNGGVYISMGHLGPELIAQKFKGMVKRCADCGFDFADGRVEVTPTAASFRFSKWIGDWFRLSGAKLIIGKGGMSPED